MAARVTRAKKKIAAAGIPYRVPAAHELPDRLDAVLTVVHLLFTTGHTAPTGDRLVRPDLVARAVDLARMLCELMPDEREVRGLLALLLLTDARRATRVDRGRAAGAAARTRTAAAGTAAAIARGAARWCSMRCAAAGPGRFALQAAIAALHAEAPTYAETDWPQIVAALRPLLLAWPSPVVALNRAVGAVHGRDGPAAGLAAAGRARRWAAGRVPLPAGRPGRPAAPAGPAGGGRGGVPRGAGAGRQRGRARRSCRAVSTP